MAPESAVTHSDDVIESEVEDYLSPFAPPVRPPGHESSEVSRRALEPSAAWEESAVDPLEVAHEYDPESLAAGDDVGEYGLERTSADTDWEDSGWSRGLDEAGIDAGSSPAEWGLTSGEESEEEALWHLAPSAAADQDTGHSGVHSVHRVGELEDEPLGEVEEEAWEEAGPEKGAGEYTDEVWEEEAESGAVAGTFLKDIGRLEQVALAPAAAIAVDGRWHATRKAMAETYNRVGGLMAAAAAELGVEVASALAVWRVESGGRKHTRGRAIIRFENHLLFRLWGKNHQTEYDRHFRHGGHAGQDGRAWQHHQIRDGADRPFAALHTGKQANEYRALALAKRLAGESLALQCISIGGPQILIRGFRTVGYDTPRQMYDAFQASERWQVLGFFDFCRTKHAPRRGELVGYIRARDWHRFARFYNGAGQVERYGARIAAAYREATTLLATPRASPTVLHPSRSTVTYPSGVVLQVVSRPEASSADEYWDPNGADVPLVDTGSANRRLNLSANFTVGELARSGAHEFEVARIAPRLVRCLQAIRDRAGRPVHVNSGYRSWGYNARLYSARGRKPTRSRHCSGQAADIAISGMSGLDVAKLAVDALGGTLGIGVDRGYAHVDVRGEWASWTYPGLGDASARARVRAELDEYRKQRVGAVLAAAASTGAPAPSAPPSTPSAAPSLETGPIAPFAIASPRGLNVRGGRRRKPVYGLIVHTTGSGPASIARSSDGTKRRKLGCTSPVECALAIYAKGEGFPHYLIGYDGAVYATCREDHVAWHAGWTKRIGGRDRWKRWSAPAWWSRVWGVGRTPLDLLPPGAASPNSCHLGVELLGGATGGSYTEEQYRALARLVVDVDRRHGLGIEDAPSRRLLGHEDVNPLTGDGGRANSKGGWDPGAHRVEGVKPNFLWSKLWALIVEERGTGHEAYEFEDGPADSETEFVDELMVPEISEV